MSEQTEALNFGPQWIRDLSNGTSVSVPPPSPGPNYKLAQFRYGKEEMLAVFSTSLKPPSINEDIADFILNKDVRRPLAMMPMTEEEQRNSMGSLNSLAVLKMMGRGQRGARGMARGGRGSGRGRSEPGFYRGFSQDESSSNKVEDGWQRDPVSRKHSWGESTSRGGFGDRASVRDNEISPRGFESTAPPGRHGRALASGNWRSSESGEGDDDGGGWMTSGSRGAERAERWRTSRDSWHREDHRRGEQGENWNQSWNRSGERNSFEDVPEWSKSDNVFEPDSGSFDDTGAFHVAQDRKPPDDSGLKESSAIEQKEDWDLELAERNHNYEPNCDVGVTKDSDTPQNKELNGNCATEESHVNSDDRQADAKDIQQQANVKDVASPTENFSPAMEKKTEDIRVKQSPGISPREEHKSYTEVLQHDDIGANLERVAESCIANLDVESEERTEERLASSLQGSVGQRSSPVNETKWFYRDPQGNEQGPFSSEEMADWFIHGYFTMQLSVRRQCDDVYLLLGDLMKRWSRVPFMPGPSPPPLTHQQVINEQKMFMQQQLLQQHYQQIQKHVILQRIQAEAREAEKKEAEMLALRQKEEEEKRLLAQKEEEERLKREALQRENEVRQQKEQEEELKREQERRKLEKQKAEEEKRKQEEAKMKLAEKVQSMKEKQTDAEESGEWVHQQSNKKTQRKRRKQQKTTEKEDKKQEEERVKRQEEERTKEELTKEAEIEQRKNTQKSEIAEICKQEGASKEMSSEQDSKSSTSVDREVRKWNERTEDRSWAESATSQEARLMEKSKKKEECKQEGKTEDSPQHHGYRYTRTRCNPEHKSFAEIQAEEEKDLQREKELELAKQRQMQSTASHGWSDKSQSPSNVKSLKAIQDEQARQLSAKQNQQQARAQSSPVTLSPAWTNAWTAGNNNVWTGNHNEEQQETEFWDDVMRIPARGTRRNQETTQKTNTTKQPKLSATKPVANGKKSVKKTTKEEENVRKIFQQAASTDPFLEWCTQSLHGVATAVDIPTFVAFLKELESPYEIHTYIREYIGDSNEAKSFAKEFIERLQSSEWKHVPKKSSSTPAKQLSPGGVVVRGGSVGPRSDFDGKDGSGGKTKKKKKQRMQKVDPSILGFSVNAAERVNMGEIQSVDDSR